jgi:hypothetical protein
MPRERDEGSGQYTERYPFGVFLDAIRDAEDGFAGTGEIAKQVGCSERLALLKLDRLADEKRVRRREIGRSSVWLLTDGESESMGEEGAIDTERTEDSTRGDTRLPDHHHAAVHEMYQYLREQSTATREELSELVAVETAPGEGDEEFVTNCLDTLGRLSSVEPPSERDRNWRFVEGDPTDRLLEEPTADAFVDLLNEGYAIVVRAEFLGESYRMRLRLREGVYYCDTPVNLHRHDTEREVRACIEKYGHVHGTIVSIE